MDLSLHKNLIQKHQYDGTIVIYEGPDHGSLIKGSAYLMKTPTVDTTNKYKERESIAYNKQYCTIESPCTDEEIEENKQKYKEKAQIVSMSCICVPKNI